MATVSLSTCNTSKYNTFIRPPDKYLLALEIKKDKRPYKNSWIEVKEDGDQIQITEELLRLHRFGDSPFSDLPIVMTVVNWSKSLSESDFLKRKSVNGEKSNQIYVGWNENISYYQEFSNAQVVAKSSVKYIFFYIK